MDKPHLENCPFCGQVPELFHEGPHWQIGCENIECHRMHVHTYWSPEKEIVIAAWNRRAPAPQPNEAAPVVQTELDPNAYRMALSATTLDNGTISLEWIATDRRFGVTLEPERKDCCWWYVDKKNQTSGYLGEAALSALSEYFGKPEAARSSGLLPDSDGTDAK